MAYNTYYGTGYNNSTLIKSWFEMNSYSTQVAHLLFEYVCGAHMAARGERAEGTGSGRGDAGPWLASGVGPKGFPGSVFIFFSSILLFLFCFLNSFTDFAKMLQINLNHLQRFYRNHCKVLSQ
jgi:hypothetical protein